MKLFVWINGRLLPQSVATIPVSDSAYLYGLGIFETLRAHQGRILFLHDHFLRLRKNALRIGLKLPLAEDVLEKQLLRLLKKNELMEATLRLILSEDENHQPRFIMTAKPFIQYPNRCYEQGAKLVVAQTVRADSKATASIKTTSYLTKMLARREATKRGADEALLMNEEGSITEGASSNIFIVKNNTLLTPPLPEGLLPGTRRKAVLKIAKKLKINIQEKVLKLSDITSADEVFITSSLKDIMPALSLDGKKIRKPTPGPITIILMKFYETIISADC